MRHRCLNGSRPEVTLRLDLANVFTRIMHPAAEMPQSRVALKTTTKMRRMRGRSHIGMCPMRRSPSNAVRGAARRSPAHRTIGPHGAPWPLEATRLRVYRTSPLPTKPSWCCGSSTIAGARRRFSWPSDFIDRTCRSSCPRRALRLPGMPRPMLASALSHHQSSRLQ